MGFRHSLRCAAAALAVCLPHLCAADDPQSVFPRPREAPRADVGTAQALSDYAAARARLEAKRAELQGEFQAARSPRARTAVLARARAELERALVTLIDPWVGTRWDFYGTTQTPGSGSIACGYFVTTLLRDAGLQLERVRLAQQASEYIVRTLAPAARTWRIRTGSVDDVLSRLRSQPERWFVVGLDLHVGLLARLDDGEVLFCHSSYLEPGYALCEDARTAGAMQSRYHVVGALFTDALVTAWLNGTRIRTAAP